MSLNSSTFLTLADWAARRDPNGGIADTVNLLSQTNEILDDLIFKEGNLATGNKTTVRTGLPSATWRMLNYGVPRGKSTTAQVTDTCGMLETYSTIDKDLANLEGDVAAFRLSEDLAFLEGKLQCQDAPYTAKAGRKETAEAGGGLAVDGRTVASS